MLLFFLFLMQANQPIGPIGLLITLHVVNPTMWLLSLAATQCIEVEVKKHHTKSPEQRPGAFNRCPVRLVPPFGR